MPVPSSAATEASLARTRRPQVRLMEALSRHPRPEAPDGEAGAPDPYRTAVCAQMLTELCAVAGPFTGVLGAIRDEMVLAVYSEYYLSESGALHFDQVPHFVVVGRLEAELADMEAQQEAWKAELAAHQEGVGAIEQRLRALDGQAEEQEHTVAELRSALAEATERYAGAKAEAALPRPAPPSSSRPAIGMSPSSWRRPGNSSSRRSWTGAGTPST